MIDYDLLKDIERYSNEHVETSKEAYAKRNQSIEKLFINIFNGKVAEWCNYFSLIEGSYIVEKPPCMRIFTGGNKSYDADIVILGKNKELFSEPKFVHVKSLSIKTFESMGISVLLQKNDPIVINPKSNHYISIMLQKSLLVYEFSKWVNSTEAIYSKPRARHLSSTKVAIYL